MSNPCRRWKERRRGGEKGSAKRYRKTERQRGRDRGRAQMVAISEKVSVSPIGSAEPKVPISYASC